MLPHADRHGADVQWMQMLKELRSQGHAVTHIARSDVNRERYQAEVERLGIRVLTPDAERMRCQGKDLPASWNLEGLLREQKFDLAILFHWFWNGISIPEDYMQDIRRLSPSTVIAVLTDDQQGLRELQMAQLTNYWPDFERAEDYKFREMEVYRRADIVLTISDDDARAFRREAPEIVTGRMPMIAEIAAEGPTYEERSNLLFLANFDNLANRDAVNWLIGEIWPLVRRQLPDAKLMLVGNHLTDEPQYRQPGIERVGFAANLAPEFAKSRVAVSPIRFGTGIKTKNLLALAHAVPLVTTTVGADGMNLRDGENALIADTPAGIAEAILRAYTDERLWQRLSACGRKHIAEEFSETRMQAAMRDLAGKARSITPKTYEPDFRWSFRRVEERFPDCVTGAPAPQRPSLRVAAYVNLADEFLMAGNPAAALAQLRHFYGLLRGRVRATSLTIRSVELAAKCYRQLGMDGKAREYETRAEQSCRSEATAAAAAPSNGKGKHHSLSPPKPELQFSVVLPTYNRQETLAKCLDALVQQTFPAAGFEVVVVDDGSKDGTAQFCRSYRAPFAFHYVRQANAGAGAARRVGVKQARGQFLLLINDDTMAAPDLLAQHYRAHQDHPNERQLVLGDFSFPPEAMERALTRFLCEGPFLFPQTTMKPGIHWDYTKAVTCNLSVRREAVLAAGSFDPEFRVAEDSELGLRLSRLGYYVRYEPAARSVHEHLPFTMDDLVRRAKAYGATQLRLLRKHPGLLGDGTTQYGWLDETVTDRWRETIEAQKSEIQDAQEALTKFDTVDFREFERLTADGRTMAGDVMRLFRRAVPEVYWHHFFSSMLHAWDRELSHPKIEAIQQRSAATDRFL